MGEEKMGAMKRAWDGILAVCAKENLNTKEKLHLLKSMTVFLSDVLAHQGNEK